MPPGDYSFTLLPISPSLYHIPSFLLKPGLSVTPVPMLTATHLGTDPYPWGLLKAAVPSGLLHALTY